MGKAQQSRPQPNLEYGLLYIKHTLNASLILSSVNYNGMFDAVRGETMLLWKVLIIKEDQNVIYIIEEVF